MTKDEAAAVAALKLALKVLERYQIKRQDFDTFADVITAIKEALALTSTQCEKQPAQEPVGHRVGFWCADLTCNKCYSAEFRFKHTTPQQRQWVGLTFAEICECENDSLLKFARAIEAALRSKNHD